MLPSNFTVFAVDIGSVKKGNFAWARLADDFSGTNEFSSSSIDELILSIKSDLELGKKVSLGFECPLTVNLPSNPQDLTSARKGDGDRAWCAGAGSSALAVGLVECAWILQRIREITEKMILPTLDWDYFVDSDSNLFLWEAFVTAKAKGLTHLEDAIIAAKSFIEAYPRIVSSSAVRNDVPYSLIGAALLRSGLSDQMCLLSQDCIVIKAGQ
jgi:hypothetical protein